jgi:hypothetical protein
MINVFNKHINRIDRAHQLDITFMDYVRMDLCAWDLLRGRIASQRVSDFYRIRDNLT